LPLPPITDLQLVHATTFDFSLGRDAMPDSDQQLEVEVPEELLADMPLPSDAKTFFLGGLFVLSMLTAAYVASEIVLPLMFAVMLNLLMQPALRALEGFAGAQSGGSPSAHPFRVRDDCRTWRRRLRSRPSVDSETA
jgi:hypothetical protein